MYLSAEFCCYGGFKIYDLKIFLLGCVTTQTKKFDQRIRTKHPEEKKILIICPPELGGWALGNVCPLLRLSLSFMLGLVLGPQCVFGEHVR